MALMKLPARAFMYGQMKYWPILIDLKSVDFFCAQNQAECAYEVQFSKGARVLQWSWLGKQPRYPFTFEGMMICFILSALILTPWALWSSCMHRWNGPAKQQVRLIAALQIALCK